MVVLSVSLGSLASADPAKHVKGDKASDLARAVKFAGVKATTAKTVRTFAAASISCTSTKEGSDGQLGDYSCSVDKLTVRDAAALLLQNALESAGLSSSDGMSKHKTNASAVSCVIDPGKSGDERFDCAYTQGAM
jgi:hypothetical protein